MTIGPIIKIFHLAHTNHFERKKSFRSFEIQLLFEDNVEFVPVKDISELEERLLSERKKFRKEFPGVRILNQIPILKYYNGGVMIKVLKGNKTSRYDFSRYGGKELRGLLVGIGVKKIYELSDIGIEQTDIYRQISPREMTMTLRNLISG